MAGVPARAAENLDYPTTDGKPMAETDWHRDLMVALIQTLSAHYANDPAVYVSGNLLIFYEPGNKRRHVSPDVFVVKGVPNHARPNYLIWQEGKGPDVVVEITSRRTRREDVAKKLALYQDRLCVPEYFLFDPLGDYLQPPLQGHRLRRGRYEPIAAAHDRMPSKVLGLHLEAHGEELRLYNPAARDWLPTPAESQHAVEMLAREEADARRQAEAEVERLRREVERLRRAKNGGK
jgi:Uma2 family endonuclease